MCKQHLVDVSQEEREKSVVPEIKIQSYVEPFAEVSKRTRLYTRLQRIPFNIESLRRMFNEKWQTQACFLFGFVFTELSVKPLRKIDKKSYIYKKNTNLNFSPSTGLWQKCKLTALWFSDVLHEISSQEC